jgi:hypothetical protein
MATLELNTLRCKRRKDVIGKDEPSIKADGVKVWNGVVAKDGSVNIGATVPFENQVRLICEEWNNTKSKQIGDAVTVRESGNPTFLTFKTSGTWYEVDFEVTESTSSSSSSTSSTPATGSTTRKKKVSGTFNKSSAPKKSLIK